MNAMRAIELPELPATELPEEPAPAQPETSAASRAAARWTGPDLDPLALLAPDAPASPPRPPPPRPSPPRPPPASPPAISRPGPWWRRRRSG